MENSNHLKIYLLLQTRAVFKPAMVSLVNIWGKLLEKTTRSIHRTVCVEKQPPRGIFLAGTDGYEGILFRFAKKIYRCKPTALRICLNWSCTGSKPDVTVTLRSTTSCLRSRLHNSGKPQPHQPLFAHAIAALGLAWPKSYIEAWDLVENAWKCYFILLGDALQALQAPTHPQAIVFARKHHQARPADALALIFLLLSC